MKLNIKTKQSQIDAVLLTAQKGCSARTIWYGDLKLMVASAEVKLDGTKFPANTLQGLQIRNSEAMPNAYKGNAEYTSVTIELGSGGKWFLTNVERVKCGRKPYGDSSLYIAKTPKMKEWEVRQITDTIGI